MQKFTRYLAFGAAALALGASTAADAKLKRITIGLNRQGSVFFLLASGFAKELQQQLKIKATAQPHAGSSVYIPLMDNGEITMGINNSMNFGAAVRGKAPFRSKNINFRAIARVWIIPYGFLVKASSNIHSTADLKGKKVVTNIKPIVSLLALNNSLLAGAGLSTSDITAMSSGGIVKNINMVVEGRVDAPTAAIVMPVVRKAHAASGVRFISVGANTTDMTLANDGPGSRVHVQKPSKRYPFITKTTKLIVFDSYLNAGKSVDNEDAYDFARVLHTQWKKLKKAYGPLRGVPQNAVAPSGNPHLYHAGAVKYYKGAGVWTAANAKQQAKIAKELK